MAANVGADANSLFCVAHMSGVLRIAHLEQRRVEPAAVHPQLLNSSGPESVTGSNQHGVLAFLDIAADLWIK